MNLLLSAGKGFKKTGGGFGEKFNLVSLDSPFYLGRLDFMALGFFLSFFILVFNLGWHTGNIMTYFTHLLAPFLLWIVFKNSAFFKGKMIAISAILIFLNLIYFVPPARRLAKKEIPNNSEVFGSWAKLTKPYKTIYNSPMTALLLHQQGKRIYDNGLSNYFFCNFESKEGRPLVKGAWNHYQKHLDRVRNDLLNQRFELVFWPLKYHVYPLFTREELSQGYKIKETRTIKTFSQSWEEEVWVPK